MSEALPAADDLPTEPDRLDLSDPMTALFQRTFSDVGDLEAESMEARVLGDLFGLALQAPKVGRFEIRGRLGGGGMGEVYLAWDPELQREVAIKLMRRKRNAQRDDILREARALAKVDSPHVVPVYEVGVHAGRGYLAMKNIEGQTLACWQSEPRSLPEIISVYGQAGRGLAAMHRRGIVHCDFKPSNVLVDAEDSAFVADFGLARLAKGEEDSCGGTRGYMAPEQLFESIASPASDQFSFCVSLFTAIHGVPPFPGKPATQAQRLARCEIETPPNARKIPRWLRRLLERGLQREPSRRFPSMDVLVEELVRDHGKAARFGGGAAGAMVVAVGLVLLQSPPPPEPSRSSDQLEGYWDSVLKGHLNQHFIDTNNPNGEYSIRSLDDWREKWLAEWDQIAPGSDPAVIKCLDRQRVRVKYLVDMLLDTDFKEPWLVQLHPEACKYPSDEDGDFDPEAYKLLAKATAARLSMKFEESLAITTELRDRWPEWPALQIDAWHEQGLNWLAAGERVRALEDLSEARTLALASADRGRLAEIFLDLAWASDPETPELRRDWLEQAEALREKLLIPGKEVRIPLLHALTDLETNRPERIALGLLDDLPGIKGTQYEVEARHVLAMTLEARGLTTDAEAEYREALRLADEILGPNHPQKAKLLTDAGTFALDAGNLDLAGARLREGLRVRRDSLPPRHPAIARSYIALAWYALDRENFVAAEDYVHNALDHGIERGRTYEAYMIRGLIAEHRKQWALAIGSYEQALQTCPDLPAERNKIGVLLAQAYAELGNRDEATLRFDQYLSPLESGLQFPDAAVYMCPTWELRLQALESEARIQKEISRIRQIPGAVEYCHDLLDPRS